jgi:hypothetical protein
MRIASENGRAYKSRPYIRVMVKPSLQDAGENAILNGSALSIFIAFLGVTRPSPINGAGGRTR